LEILGVENVPLLWAFKVPRVPRAGRFVAAGDAGLQVIASIGDGFGIASAWEDFRCASEREDLEEEASMPLKWMAGEGASGD
jgi:hypothetical protein